MRRSRLSVAVGLIILGAVSIMLFVVYGSIHLNDQALGGTEEIHYKWADRLLAAEFPPVELFAAQRLPEDSFTRSRLFAKLLRDFDHLRPQRLWDLPAFNYRLRFPFLTCGGQA